MNNNDEQTPFPAWFLIAPDWDPNAHMMQIERFDKRSQRKTVADYLNVQNRLLWFIRDQRRLIAAGLAKVPYVIKTHLVEIDHERGYAHFCTYIMDVIGNEATMYGSETATDFGDYAEKASTKSIGRALLLLGYGTAMAPEMDEGEQVVDNPVDKPVDRRREAPATPPSAATTPNRPAAATEPLATERQGISILKLSRELGRTEPDVKSLTFAAARALLTELSAAYAESRQAS